MSVNAILIQRIFYLLSTCWYFKFHKIPSCCLNPFCLLPPLTTYKNRWELQTPLYLLEEENHQQRNHQNIKNTRTTREATQTEERANLECPDKEIKETTPLNPIELLPYKFTLQRQLESKTSGSTETNKKKSPKMGRQR